MPAHETLSHHEACNGGGAASLHGCIGGLVETPCGLHPHHSVCFCGHGDHMSTTVYYNTRHPLPAIFEFRLSCKQRCDIGRQKPMGALSGRSNVHCFASAQTLKARWRTWILPFAIEVVLILNSNSLLQGPDGRPKRVYVSTSRVSMVTGMKLRLCLAHVWESRKRLHRNLWDTYGERWSSHHGL